MDKQLYMIAVVPDNDAKVLIDKIREDFSDKYQVNEALRNPAHITVVPPFHATKEQVEIIKAAFEKLYRSVDAFKVVIDKYGFFKKNRVVFLEPVDDKTLPRMMRKAERVITDNCPDIKLKVIKRHTPHITIGYRDLSKAVFDTTVEELQDKTESISWTLGNIQIWERGNDSWSTIYEIPLAKEHKRKEP